MKISPEFQTMFAQWKRASGSDARAMVVLGDSSYTRRFRMPKWSVPVSALMSTDVAIRHANELGLPLSKSAHQQRATYLRQKAFALHVEHQRLVRAAGEKYGEHGSLISGGLRDHWPTNVKEMVRFAAQGAQLLDDAARLHDALTKTRSPKFRW